MKKTNFLSVALVCLFLLGFSNVSTAADNIALDNGDDATLEWSWGWGMTHQIVNNPKTDAVNGTAKVREVTPEDAWKALSQGNLETYNIDLSVYTQFEMLVYCPTLDVLPLIVEFKAGETAKEFGWDESCKNGWVKIIQDIPADLTGNLSQLTIKNGNGTAGVKFYVDDIKFISAGGSSNPAIVVDNSEGTKLKWDWSYGMTREIVTNPGKDAVNGTDDVLKLIPEDDWKALKQGSLNIDVDFSIYSQFEMLVYCPTWSTGTFPIAVVLNGTEYGFDVTLSSGWTKITQDVSTLTGPLTEIEIKNGGETKEVTFYIDEIKFASTLGTSLSETTTKDHFVHFNGESIVINGLDADTEYTIYNALGALVAQGKLQGTNTISTENLSKGVCIVKLLSKGKQFSEKVYIH